LILRRYVQFEGAVASQPSIAIDLPIVIAAAGYRGAALSPRGMNHVGLG